MEQWSNGGLEGLGVSLEALRVILAPRPAVSRVEISPTNPDSPP